MDERTPEERAADEALLDAISNRFRVFKIMNPDEVVDQYVVTAYINGLELQDENCSKYGYAYRDSGNGPHSSSRHVILGLIEQHRQHLQTEG